MELKVAISRPKETLAGLKNPFNGIERHHITSNPHLKGRGVLNPFNGIESFSATISDPEGKEGRIHSMELKAVLAPASVQNARR